MAAGATTGNSKSTAHFELSVLIHATPKRLAAWAETRRKACCKSSKQSLNLEAQVHASSADPPPEPALLISGFGMAAAEPRPLFGLSAALLSAEFCWVVQ